MMSLLLHGSEAKLRTNVNNKDIIQMFLDYNLLISHRTSLVLWNNRQWLLVVITCQDEKCVNS